jgi:hypothetical protein
MTPPISEIETTQEDPKTSLTLDELADIFQFTPSDLLANRAGRYSMGQHRILIPSLLMVGFAVLVAFTLPLQRELGRVLGIFGAMCAGGVDLLAVLAAFAGIGGLINSSRESRETPLVTFTGYVDLKKTTEPKTLEESWALISTAFEIPIETEAAERFIPADYTVYYVPKFVNDRDNLFSIEPPFTPG